MGMKGAWFPCSSPISDWTLLEAVGMRTVTADSSILRTGDLPGQRAIRLGSTGCSTLETRQTRRGRSRDWKNAVFVKTDAAVFSAVESIRPHSSLFCEANNLFLKTIDFLDQQERGLGKVTNSVQISREGWSFHGHSGFSRRVDPLNDCWPDLCAHLPSMHLRWAGIYWLYTIKVNYHYIPSMT